MKAIETSLISITYIHIYISIYELYGEMALGHTLSVKRVYFMLIHAQFTPLLLSNSYTYFATSSDTYMFTNIIEYQLCGFTHFLTFSS